MGVGFLNIKNYITTVNKIEKSKPNFQRNISRNLTYGIESIAQATNIDAFTRIIAKINDAPESIYKTLSSILIIDKPNNLHELQKLRTSLKVSCRKNQDAKEYMTGLRDFLLNNPENQELIKFIGKGSKQYVLSLIKNPSLRKPVMKNEIAEYFKTTKEILDKLSDSSLQKHLQNFFDYIINGNVKPN